ncbi:transposase family protein [Streptomyces violaceorubidus]
MPVHLRHAVMHDVPACWFGVGRSTITRVIGEVRPLLAGRGCTVSRGVRLRTLAEVIDHLGASRKTGIIDGIEIRVGRPAAERKDRDKFISGKSKQNAVKAMVVADGDGRMLLCSPTQHGNCADITYARQLGLVRLLDGSPAAEILAGAGYQGLGAHTSGRVVTPPHCEFNKNAPGWYEEMHERQRKSALLAAYPRRTQHCAPEGLAGTGPPPRPPRAHQRDRASHRRPALPSADRRPDPNTAGLITKTPVRSSTSHRLPCTSSLETTKPGQEVRSAPFRRRTSNTTR